MTMTTFNEEQRRAIEAGGVVFVSAGVPWVFTHVPGFGSVRNDTSWTVLPAG